MKLINRYTTLAAALAITATFTSISHAGLPAYMAIEGGAQGDIEGGGTGANDGEIEILAAEHLVNIPTDAASGLPSGRRQHRPLKVTKRIDQATPLLISAMVNNENLNVVIKFYRRSQDGTPENYYSIELTNARVSSARMWKPSTLDPASTNVPELMEFQFVYHSIRWVYEDGSIEASDFAQNNP